MTEVWPSASSLRVRAIVDCDCADVDMTVLKNRFETRTSWDVSWSSQRPSDSCVGTEGKMSRCSKQAELTRLELAFRLGLCGWDEADPMTTSFILLTICVANSRVWLDSPTSRPLSMSLLLNIMNAPGKLFHHYAETRCIGSPSTCLRPRQPMYSAGYHVQQGTSSMSRST